MCLCCIPSSVPASNIHRKIFMYTECLWERLWDSFSQCSSLRPRPSKNGTDLSYHNMTNMVVNHEAYFDNKRYSQLVICCCLGLYPLCPLHREHALLLIAQSRMWFLGLGLGLTPMCTEYVLEKDAEPFSRLTVVWDQEPQKVIMGQISVR